MSAYTLTVLCLCFAIVAQTIATLAALRATLRPPYRRAWLALTIAFSLLALHYGFTLELTTSTGLYDLPQAALAAIVSDLLALGIVGLGREAGPH
ncbi:MAG: hypothetical protein KA538_01515 [Azonexus sp.]|jgi:hypothetical protein|nr:hypothetical protein [Azonexus sp.]